MKTTTIDRLFVGNCFLYEHTLYMKIEEMYYENAVSLANGALVHFAENEPIIPIDTRR